MGIQKLTKSVPDLTLALVITSNVIISCQSATAHLFRKADFQPQKLNLPERRNVFGRNELLETYLQNRGQELLKRPKRADLLRKWNVRAVQVQLDIVIDRYHVLNKKMQDLYVGVIGCGSNGCQNFQDFIPKIKHHPNTKLFNKRRRHLGKKIYELLETFHDGLQKIDTSYNAMLKYENTSGLYNSFRSELLQLFKRDIKALNVEVEAAMSVRNTQIVQKKDNTVYYIFPFPSNHTDLIIQEWYVIQGSKNFLMQWRKILDDLEMETNTLARAGRRFKKRNKSKQKPRKKIKIRKRKGNHKSINS